MIKLRTRMIRTNPFHMSFRYTGKLREIDQKLWNNSKKIHTLKLNIRLKMLYACVHFVHVSYGRGKRERNTSEWTSDNNSKRVDPGQSRMPINFNWLWLVQDLKLYWIYATPNMKCRCEFALHSEHWTHLNSAILGAISVIL